jgi:hypothetical protein
MRSFERARRPEFCLEFEAEFPYLFPRSHKKFSLNGSIFSGKSH